VGEGFEASKPSQVRVPNRPVLMLTLCGDSLLHFGDSSEILLRLLGPEGEPFGKEILWQSVDLHGLSESSKFVSRPQGSLYYSAKIFFLMETWNDGPDSFLKLYYVHRWKKRETRNGTRNRGWAQPFENVLMRP